MSPINNVGWWIWLDLFKWPVGDDIARRAVPAPGFVRVKDSIILLPLAEIRFCDLNRHAGTYVEDWLRMDTTAGQADFKELKRPAGAKKAQVSAMVSLLKPAKPVAASIEDQSWVPDDPKDCPSLSPLMAFLEQLLAVGEG